MCWAQKPAPYASHGIPLLPPQGPRSPPAHFDAHAPENPLQSIMQTCPWARSSKPYAFMYAPVTVDQRSSSEDANVELAVIAQAKLLAPPRLDRQAAWMLPQSLS